MLKRDEHLTSIPEAAEILGVTTDCLLNWMDDNGWGIFNDASFDVMPDQVNSGNLVIKDKGALLTPKGLDALRAKIKRPKPSAPSARRPRKTITPDTGDDVPF